MGLLGNTVSVTRFNAAVPREGPDFERARFWEIEPGSEVRERMGFVPFELDAPYEAALGRYVFRVRVDRIRPDATAVKERLRELVKTEREATGKTFVGSKTRKMLKDLAEAELCSGQKPKTSIVEAVLDGPLLYIASASNNVLGRVVTLLRQAGVECDFKAPWLDTAPETEERSDVALPQGPGKSVLGCQFLKALLDEADVMVEPEAGLVRLATREGRVTLSGQVLNHLHRYLDEGAEILSAKIHMGKVPFRFEAPAYRLAGVKFEPVKAEHWTMALFQRLEQIEGLFAELDLKYSRLMKATTEPPAVGERTDFSNAVMGKLAEGLEETRGPGDDTVDRTRTSVTISGDGRETVTLEDVDLGAAARHLRSAQ